jgi:hypothetical protein
MMMPCVCETNETNVYIFQKKNDTIIERRRSIVLLCWYLDLVKLGEMRRIHRFVTERARNIAYGERSQNGEERAAQSLPKHAIDRKVFALHTNRTTTKPIDDGMSLRVLAQSRSPTGLKSFASSNNVRDETIDERDKQDEKTKNNASSRVVCCGYFQKKVCAAAAASSYRR